MHCFSINLGIALIWLFLARGAIPSFLFGWMAGFGLLAAFPEVFGSHEYVRRKIAFARFVIVFLREFLMANVHLSWAIIVRSRNKMHPNFITYDVEGLSKLELFILAQCISLTPGTTSVEVCEDQKKLVLHAFDADEPQRVRDQLDKTLKQAILAFTR